MNTDVIKLFSGHDETVPGILPHQLATVDFLVRRVLDDGVSVLLFHIMGSGKTVIALLFAMVASRTKKVYILVPNVNVMNIFSYSMVMVANLFNAPFVPENIFIYSTTSFYSLNCNDGVINYNGLAKYESSVFVVDEAHNIFGNNTGELMMVIKNKTRVPFLLLSASPITNTPITLSSIISLMSETDVDIGDIVVQGKKVFQILLNEHGVRVIRDVLKGRVSYYEMPDTDMPEVIYHGRKFLDTRVVYCRMSKLQEDDYLNVRRLCNNEMFEKNMNNVSMAVLGPLNLVNNLDVLFQAQEKDIYPNLRISNGVLYGNELTKLDISCKFKYFVSKVNNMRGKHFIYFSNSTYGSLVIRHVMLSNGYSEYNGSQSNNPHTVDGRPKTFAIVTSKMKSSLEELLDAYNSADNNDGSQLMFLFSSNIMSESYTLKEVRHIWFMTIPDTFSQYNQILGRAVRKFSYADVTAPVNVYLMAAVYSDFDEDIVSLEDYSVDDINALPFDIKKLFYLKFKAKETNRVYAILQNLSESYSARPHPQLVDVVLGEIVRQFFARHCRVGAEDAKLVAVVKAVLGTREAALEYIRSVVDGHFFVTNKTFGKCLLYQHERDIVTVPFQLEHNAFAWAINFRKEVSVVNI
ncbi:putative early transcription factor VETF-like protein [Seal parapoxvirus]|uniref:Putative early transcription factor VETF-like protein n=1 Tax=Seal parapoxvirus TaxID=187984 RepID=A0A1Z3GCU2_9POXV|nr:putative early transcription factor VETF-like protein [Seal parapoxvirus]ASC55571.1 putative early transcription factor VETF-like protein [Seal parapoxvirus]